ncbi:MAG: GNAT family N-acetyltransferase [Lachnospiraceae bacterium]|nr:GNAT family N-acetyltransferase [Lachnospiraceae bacterium]
MGKLEFPLLTEHLSLQPENEDNLWNAAWTISLRDEEETRIGTFSFEGDKMAGEVPVRVELEQDYRNLGYGTEVFAFMARWAFRFRNIREVNAVCDHENDRCVHALEKAGYVCRENKGGKDYYSVKRQKSAWAGLYIMVGFCAGFLIGLSIANLWVGTAIGVIAGGLVGVILDVNDKKGR